MITITIDLVKIMSLLHGFEIYVFAQELLLFTTVKQIITEVLEKNTDGSLLKINEPRLLLNEEEMK